MKVLKKSEWEKVLAIPVEFLSDELGKMVTKHRKVISAYLKGDPIEYHNGVSWYAVNNPAFDINYNYRVHVPTMDFHITLEEDEADALRRVLSGQGLNAQEMLVVTAISDRFQKQFDVAFKSKG